MQSSFQSIACTIWPAMLNKGSTKRKKNGEEKLLKGILFWLDNTSVNRTFKTECLEEFRVWMHRSPILLTRSCSFQIIKWIWKNFLNDLQVIAASAEQYFNDHNYFSGEKVIETSVVYICLFPSNNSSPSDTNSVFNNTGFFIYGFTWHDLSVGKWHLGHLCEFCLHSQTKELDLLFGQQEVWLSFTHFWVSLLISLSLSISLWMACDWPLSNIAWLI